MLKLFPIAIGVTVGLLSAQTFDVASIRLSTVEGEGSSRESIRPGPDGLTMRNVGLRSCLSWAHGVQDFQITGQVSAVDRYDIAAKAQRQVSLAELRGMLRALLADRFKLTFHRENKVQSAYALVVGKGGSRMTESKDDIPGLLRPGKVSLAAQHTSMLELAGFLAGPLRTPVIDRTGLTARYDFTLDLTSYFAEAGVEIPSAINGALHDQLGLTLESCKEPIEILVVDHSERVPSAN